MKKNLSAVIIEDESLARDLIKAYLKPFSNIEICGEYADGYSGILAVNSDRPDIIFLDIRLPKISGIELVELLDYSPEIIFTTAHDEYAIKAFEMNAVDYLLKPFSKERFEEAVERALGRTGNETTPFPAGNLAKHIDPEEFLSRIVVKDKNQIHIIPDVELYYLEAQDDYVMIHTHDKRFMKQSTMKSFEDRLDSKSFVRVHRSYIVRIDKISRLEQYEKENYKISLDNRVVVPVSRSGYKTLKAALGL